MNSLALSRILLAGALFFSSARLRAADEADLLAILNSPAEATAKWAACQKLRMTGSPKAVPALAALLPDERLSQAARYALEALPYPEAGAALREALAKTSGMTRAGIIDSMGWRAEPASVPVLTPLLLDSNTTIATAAATSLGRIGGPEAVTALTAARDRAPAEVQLAFFEALLKCAERFASGNDHTGSAAIYRGLLNDNYPAQVRSAAWRGLAVEDSEHRTDLALKALTGTDRPIQRTALKLVRESNDRALLQACVGQWTSLPAEAQLAVVDGFAKLGSEALPSIRTAGQSKDVRVRVATWQALGELNDVASVALLAQAAAQAESAERDAARESLIRLHGPGVTQAMLSRIVEAGTAEQAELLRALGERGDRAATDTLLKNAHSDVPPVRLAALGALGSLAPPQAAATLLELAAKEKRDGDREPVLNALFAICDASASKEDVSVKIVDLMNRYPPAERQRVLSLLAELGTPAALAAAQAASRDPDAELAREAVRVFSRWPNASPAVALLELGRVSPDPTLQTLALRGAIQVSGQEPDLAQRLNLLEKAMASSKRLEERKQALGQISQVPTPDALELTLNHLAEPGLTDEACLAALTIAEKLAQANPGLADQAATRVLQQVKEGDLARRALALRRKQAANAPFLRDWLVCGPYRQAGAVGATAVFELAFPPEKQDSKVEWKTVPPGDHVNLLAIFPDQENCAAYLRTRVIAPQDCQAVLLMGSDDGLKVWLNGKIVHSNNVDRGEVADQDAAPINLRKGENDLMFKVTQGGGGWSASARIVAPDFTPVPGLKTERPPE